MNLKYFYRGPVERPSKRSYRFVQGFSQNGQSGPLSPWLTKAEARKDASLQGGKAVFVPSGPCPVCQDGACETKSLRCGK